MRPLSYTGLVTYETCPLRWKLKYVTGAKPDPVPEPEPLALGKALHEALEAYHRGSGGAGAARRKLNKADVPPEARARGARVLEAFHRRELRRPRQVLAVEQPFRVDLDGLPFVGVIDRLEAAGDGVAVVDYKSGFGRPMPWLVESSAQLGYYQIGATDGLGLDVDHLAIEHLSSGLRFSSDPRTPDALGRLKARAHAAWDAARAQVFPATPHRRCPCEFASRCPYYKDLRPTILDWDGSARRAVAEDVERYAADRDPDARRRIEAHLERHGVLRAWGPTHVVERTPGGQVRVRSRGEVAPPVEEDPSGSTRPEEPWSRRTSSGRTTA